MPTPPYGHVITFLCTRPNSSLGDAPETKSTRRKGPKEAGVKAVFLPGTSLDEIVKWTEENVRPLGRNQESTL